MTSDAAVRSLAAKTDEISGLGKLSMPNHYSIAHDTSGCVSGSRSARRGRWCLPGLIWGRSFQVFATSFVNRLGELCQQSINCRLKILLRCEADNFFDHFSTLEEHDGGYCTDLELHGGIPIGVLLQSENKKWLFFVWYNVVSNKETVLSPMYVVTIPELGRCTCCVNPCWKRPRFPISARSRVPPRHVL